MFDSILRSKRASQVASVSSSHRMMAPVGLLALGLSAVLAACGGGSSGVAAPGTSSGAVNSVVAHPSGAQGSQLFVVGTNQQGQAGTIQLMRTMWGRLVDIRDIDASLLRSLTGVTNTSSKPNFANLSAANREAVLNSGELLHVDFPVSERVVTDNTDFVLRTNAVTGETTLTILADASADNDAALGRREYETLLLSRADDLIPIQKKSLSVTEIPPFSVAPRNSAIVLEFNDLIDANSVNNQTVRLLTGNPPSSPFTNVRVFTDANHGDLGPGGAFRSTRVIIDTTISDIEAQEAGAQGQLLQTSAVGLPASVTVGQANAVLRIGTRRFLPSDPLLQNLSGGPVGFQSDSVRDPSSATLDILRAFRTGGATSVTGDLNNGYLLDLDPPRIIGAQGVQVVVTDPNAGPGVFEANLSFDIVSCRIRPLVGDVVQQGQVFAEVIENGTPPDDNGLARDVLLRVVSPSNGILSSGAGLYQSPYDPIANQGNEGCFVRFQPGPTETPGGSGEVRGILSGATASLRFSEPMAPGSLTPYDSFTITRVDAVPAAEHYVVGRINRTGDLRQFSFVPALPFAKSTGAVNDYYVNLAAGTDGPTDLAGNALSAPLPQIRFELSDLQPDQNNAGTVLRFASTDEIPDPNNKPEIRGQFLYDFARGLIRPRPVTRFSGVADRTQAVPSLMTITPLGIQTPLSGLGSKLQTVWRHIDVGFGLLDETTHNVDVEGLAWAPKSGAVFQESYDQFEISLAHSKWLPDEEINPTTLFPQYEASGLVPNYGNNILSPTEDPLRVVHERSLGYLVEAVTFPASTGTQMVRFPWNVGLAPSARTTYTWRDTSITALGGPSGAGADPEIFETATGVGDTEGIYPVNQVPTIGLPLLMEFKCYPSKELGLNGFDTNFAANSSPRPNFRAFSTGGINENGVPVLKNPDLELIASGGFNPQGGGSGTLTTDNTFYIGQMDLVTRISRVYTIWFDTLSTSPTYVVPTVEPRPENQPEGTQLVLAYRGASQVSSAFLRQDACYIDPYGDPVMCGDPAAVPPQSPVYINSDSAWKGDISAVQGAQFLQIRMTFISNSETSLTPVLSSLGLAYTL